MAGANAVHKVVTQLLTFLPAGVLVPAVRLPCVGRTPLASVAVAVAAIALSIWWGICRHEPYAWMLQDIMGICLIISVIAVLYLPNLKVIQHPI